MIATRPTKAEYTEAEAAETLGITVEQLRTIVRDHILKSDDEVPSLSVASFQPSDLLVLRILSLRCATATASH